MNYLLDSLLDAGSFRSWDAGPAESVITGAGLIKRHRVALVASDFGFQGGSIGLLAGERLTRAIERATAERLPLVALPASGGTRMQEGTAAFLQMLKVTAAVTAHKAAGLPYLAYLRHPTTGGVLASWASLAHVTVAEPGALIGFLGPRVYAALERAPFPAGVQVAGNLHAHGLLDAVISPQDLAPYLARVLRALPAAPPPPLTERRPPPLAPSPPSRDGDGDGAPPASAGPRGSHADAWRSVARTRQPGYPHAAGFLRVAAPGAEVVRASGGLALALGRVGGAPVVLAGQDRDGPLTVAGLRLARRGMRLAEGLALPLITVIDTPGGELSVAAEEAGIAREIARCVESMVTLRAPAICVLLGQGTGGAALALLPADRVIAAEHAWLAPLAPEGASAIVYRDTSHAAEMARGQGIRAADLAAAGIVDVVIPETAGLLGDLSDAVRAAVASLAELDDDSRLATRTRRFRTLGTRPPA